jgi:arginase family enzyme
MPDKSIRILNFDDSLIKQHNLLFRYDNEIIDLKNLAGQARYWMNRKIKKEIEQRIRAQEKDCITFLGSGDFHHISHILINQFEEPISLIIFDFHPDWDTLPPRLGCGSWVSETLKNKNILKCILLGVSSGDISNWWVQSGNLESLKDDRVEIYPYAHKPSLAFFKKIPQNISFKFKRGPFWNKIYWNELEGKNLSEFFLSILRRIPTKGVYLSIDKDCLKKEYAFTNWEEGLFSLDELLLALRIIKENFDVVGIDIAGDYSEIFISNKLKAIFSKFDHPKDFPARDVCESIITATNEKTNLRILETFLP